MNSSEVTVSNFNAAAFETYNSLKYSYNPYIVKTSSSSDKLIMITGEVISALLPFVFCTSPLTVMVVIALLGAFMMVYLTRNNMTPSQMYEKLQGRIQNQIETALTSNDVSDLRARLKSLLGNVHRQAELYISTLGISSGSDFSSMLDVTPILNPDVVEVSLSGVTDLIEGGDFYTIVDVDVGNPFAFLIFQETFAADGSRLCLSGVDGGKGDGSRLRFQSCNTDYLGDKTFYYMDDSKRLGFRNDVNEQFCVYIERKMDCDLEEPVIRIKYLHQPECNGDYNAINVHYDNVRIYYADCIFYCIPGAWGLYAPNIRTDHVCETDDPRSTFELAGNYFRLTAPLTAENTVAHISYREIGVELYHILALKEKTSLIETN